MNKNKKKYVKGLLYFKLIIKCFVILFFLSMILLANYLFFFGKYRVALRLLDVLCFIVFVVYFLLKTQNGMLLVTFFRLSLEELRKVFWPTKRETFYTTCVVVVVTFFMSLIFWCLDSFLVRAISFILRL